MRRSWIDEKRFEPDILKDLLSRLKQEFLVLSEKHEQLNKDLASCSDLVKLSRQSDEIKQCFNRIDYLRDQLNPLISIWNSLPSGEKQRFDTSFWDDLLDEISDMCKKHILDQNKVSTDSPNDLRYRIASRKGAG